MSALAAQDLDETFTSASGHLRVRYPSAWAVEETFDDAAVVLASSRPALQRHDAGAAPAVGDLVVSIGVLPASLFEQKELTDYDIRVGAAPEDFLRSALAVLEVRGDARLDEVDGVALTPTRDAGRVAVTENDREGVILGVPAGDRAAALISTVTAPGEGAAVEPLVRRLAAEVVFDGDADALYLQLLTGG